MNILKIAFFSIIFLASAATIYFLGELKSELTIVVDDYQSESKRNTKFTADSLDLETENAELEASIADIKINEELVQEKIDNKQAEIAGTTAELAAFIAKSDKEQPEAKAILDQLAVFEDNRSKISKIDRYHKQLQDLTEEIQEVQAGIASAVAVNQSLTAVNKTNEMIINLFKTATVQDNFKAQVTQIVPDWKIVLLDAGFHKDRLSPNTKLTVMRDNQKIADLVVSKVTKDKSVASVEKYYMIKNELGEEQEASIAIGDRVVGLSSDEAA